MDQLSGVEILAGATTAPTQVNSPRGLLADALIRR